MGPIRARSMPLDFEPGEHVGVVYDQADDRLAGTIRLVIAGLRCGKRVWLALNEPLEAVVDHLAAEGIDVVNCLASEQLIFGPVPFFQRDRAETETWIREMTARALNEGFTGLWLAIEAPEELLAADVEFTADLRAGSTENQFAVLCFHCQARLDADHLRELFHSHSFVLTASALRLLDREPASPDIADLRRRREAFHAGFFDHHFEPMLLIDPRNTQIVDANPAACEFYGYSCEAIRNLRLSDLDMEAPEELFRVLDQIRDGYSVRFETRHRLDGGKIRAVEVHCGTIRRLGRTLFYAIVRDMSAQRLREQALRESQELLLRLVDMIPGGGIFSTPDGRVQFMNAAAEQMLGITREAITAFTYDDLKARITALDGRPLSEDLLTFRRVLETGEAVSGVQCAIRRLDDRVIYVSVSSAPYRGPDGEIEGVLSALADITEQVQTAKERERLLAQLDQERRQAQQQVDWWTVVFGAMTDAVIIYNAEGRILVANPATKHAYGLDPVGMDRVILAQKLRLRHSDGRAVQVEELPTSRCLRGEVVQDERFIFTNAEGRDLTILVSASPLYQGGRVNGIVAVWRDVSEREQLLQQLDRERARAEKLADQAQRHAEKWNLVFNSLTDIVVIYDATGRIISANPAAIQAYGPGSIEMLQYSREELLKMALARHAEDSPVFAVAELPSSRALRGEVVINESLTFTNYVGESHTLLLSATPLRDEGQVIGAVTIGHDVTEREQLLRQIEEERRRAETWAREAEQGRQLLQTLIDTLPMGLIGIDATGCVMLSNPAAEKILKKSFRGDGAECQIDYILCRPDGTPLALEELPLQRALTEGLATRNDEQLLCYRDGTQRIIQESVNPVRDAAGKIQGAVTIFEDITERKQAEAERERLLAALDAESRRLRTILDTLPVGVFITDAGGREIERNKIFTRIWGGQVTEIPKIGSQDAYDAYRAWWAQSGRRITFEDWSASRALARGEVSIGEVIDIQRFDGTRGTILNSAAPIRNAQGEIIGCVVAVQDITQQRRLELEAVEQRRQFEKLARELATILETLDIGVAVTDRDHRIIRVNRAVAEAVGAPSETLVGRPMAEITGHPEGDELRRRIFETGQPQRWTAVGYTFPPGSSTLRYFDIAMAPIFNAEGRVEWALATYKEVTAHVRARQEAELERARWLTTLTTLPLPVIVVDPQGVIQMANQFAEAFRKRPLIGERWMDAMSDLRFFDPKTGNEVPLQKHPLARALNGEIVQGFETILVEPDGSRIPLLLHTAPILVESAVVGAVLVGQDLTRLKEADRIKDQFLAMVSHDLRSPLATIKGWAAMAQESPDPEVWRRSLEMILKGAQTQQRLIDDLLDSAALAVGMLRVFPEVQDIRPIVESVCTGIQSMGAERGIRLSWQLPADPVFAGVDGVRLQQILGNLIANAFKFTSRNGAVEIQLDQDANWAVLTVRDTGRGIPAEQLPYIFERFYSPGGSQQPTSRSLGLGLAIVKALVELHGGSVDVWSEGVQRGSTFTVRLPLAAARG